MSKHVRLNGSFVQEFVIESRKFGHLRFELFSPTCFTCELKNAHAHGHPLHLHEMLVHRSFERFGWSESQTPYQATQHHTTHKYSDADGSGRLHTAPRPHNTSMVVDVRVCTSWISSVTDADAVVMVVESRPPRSPRWPCAFNVAVLVDRPADEAVDDAVDAAA